MKPFTADQLKDTGEALEFIYQRAEVLQALNQAAWKMIAEGPSENKTERDLLNVAAALLTIMGDELDNLEAEINAAAEVNSREN